MAADLSVSSPQSDIVDSTADEGCSSVISKLLFQLVSSFTPSSAGATGYLLVLAIRRYLGEWASEGGGQPSSCYLYDVTVSDGGCQVRCHLSPELNSLVQRNNLRAGCMIHITRCSLVYDEKRLGHCFLQIEALELGFGDHTSYVDVTALSTASLQDLAATQRGRVLLAALQSATPLKEGRAHYLPLWNNSDPAGLEWSSPKISLASEVPLDASGLASLQQLSRTWKTKVNYPHLLVRVMYKSRLRYYGRPGTKVDFPYQAYLEVADHSGMMPVVLWNSLCRDWYQSLHVGTVLLLHCYTIKQSYQRRTWATPFDSQMKSYRFIEICLNPRNPCAEIQIVPPKQIRAEWRLPDIKYNFITRVELDSLPDTYTCDIIGVVTFVGRCERRRKEEGSEDFYLYRWVHAVDGSTQQPFILEIFETSQPEAFQQIHPMTYLVCTQMRVVRESSVPYLTTSNESQISITGHHKGQPYTKDPKVKGFIQWMKGQREKDLLKRSVIGGYYSFPPAPSLFQDYCKTMNAEVVLTSTSDLQKVIAGLHYKESRRITLQATIAAVQFVSESVGGHGTGPVQKAEDQTSLLLREGHTSSLLPPGPVLPGKPPEKVQAVPSKGQQRRRSPVLNHYALRHRYPLRDLQKTDTSKWQASRERSLNAAGVLKKKKQPKRLKALELKMLCQNPVMTTAHTRRASDRVAEDSAKDKGPSQDTEEPVVATAGEHERSGEKDMNPFSHYLWKSSLWPGIRGHLSAHLHFGQLLSESVPRKFHYLHRDFLKEQYNLQASEYKPPIATSKMDLQRFDPACNHGYYSVTIVGINHQVAVDVVFLPAMASHESLCTLGRPMPSHDNKLASILASGYICDEESANDGQQGQTSPSPDQIVRTAAELDNLHVVCVLDLCHHGGDKSEVILNKIYRVTE
ncbi:RPA-related protein RADX isoform X2 [Narcine bancroftii]|uniref:RPA-related protein RADX isoform X2 n=1 Tax=Narcine bancroftii TaxID=1343680 RepID=UPI0038320B25